MIDRAFRQFAFVSAVLVLASGALATRWGAPNAAGVLAGGVWNLLSLWCLSQLLGAWLGPVRSTRRAVIWLLIKFPLLYGAAVLFLYTLHVSMIGFGIGFTIVLFTAMAFLGMQARQLSDAAANRQMVR